MRFRLMLALVLPLSLGGCGAAGAEEVVQHEPLPYGRGMAIEVRALVLAGSLVYLFQDEYCKRAETRKPLPGVRTMKAALKRMLAAVIAAVAVAGFTDRPASLSAAEAGAGVASSTLSVWMYCEYGYCEAGASGGSGNYTWTWANANPHNTSGTISTATPCWSYNGATVTVTATVSDGTSTATARRRYTCSY